MKAVLVDSDPVSLNYLKRLCTQLPELEVSACFENAEQALHAPETQCAELLLTETELLGGSGLEMVRKLRMKGSNVGVIFITGSKRHALEAFQLEAVAYQIKPCGMEELRKAVIRARKLSCGPMKRVEIRTFGRFTVLIDGEPYRFANRKAKELLALLVDRNGAIVSMEQVSDILWGDRAYDTMVKRLYRKAVAVLNRLCQEKKLDFFVSNRGSCHISPDKIKCDFFSLLQGDVQAEMQFSGEYLTDYSWAEPTVGMISRRIQLRGLSGKKEEPDQRENEVTDRAKCIFTEVF